MTQKTATRARPAAVLLTPAAEARIAAAEAILAAGGETTVAGDLAHGDGAHNAPYLLLTCNFLKDALLV